MTNQNQDQGWTKKALPAVANQQQEPEPAHPVPQFGVPQRVIAYQLSLLGDVPKPCHNWRRPYYTVRFFGGINFPLMDDEIRQNILLRADSMPEPSFRTPIDRREKE